MKENMTPYFTPTEELPTYVADPYPKYEDRPADQWNTAFHHLIDEEEEYVAFSIV